VFTSIDTRVVKIDDGKVIVSITAFEDTPLVDVTIGVIIFEKEVNRGKFTLTTEFNTGPLADDRSTPLANIIKGSDIEINTNYFAALSHFDYEDLNGQELTISTRKIEESIQALFLSDNGPIRQIALSIFFTERS